MYRASESLLRPWHSRTRPHSLHSPGTQIEDLHARVHMSMNIFVNVVVFMLVVLSVFVIYVRECGRVHAHVSSMINSRAQNLIGDQVLLKASPYIPLIQIYTYTYAYTAQFQQPTASMPRVATRRMPNETTPSGLSKARDPIHTHRLITHAHIHTHTHTHTTTHTQAHTHTNTPHFFRTSFSILIQPFS